MSDIFPVIPSHTLATYIALLRPRMTRESSATSKTLFHTATYMATEKVHSERHLCRFHSSTDNDLRSQILDGPRVRGFTVPSLKF